LKGCHKLENLPVEFRKLQSLVEFDWSVCWELGCLLDSILNLSHLKTFQLKECDKLKISQCFSRNFKAWKNFTYLVVPSWVVYSTPCFNLKNSNTST
jgi:hypothetical protein